MINPPEDTCAAMSSGDEGCPRPRKRGPRRTFGRDQETPLTRRCLQGGNRSDTGRRSAAAVIANDGRLALALVARNARLYADGWLVVRPHAPDGSRIRDR